MNMKKILSFLLCLVMVFSLAACGAEEAPETSAPTTGATDPAPVETTQPVAQVKDSVVIAIGSEPEFPELDTQPMWQKVITGNAVANGLFMVVPNRWGDEGNLTFFGSSFICDPYGRVLVEAPRNESAVLVADLDLDQRGHWLSLFPFLENRRPETYGVLTAEAPGPAPAPSAAPAAGMSVDAGIRG